MKIENRFIKIVGKSTICILYLTKKGQSVSISQSGNYWVFIVF